MTGKFMENRMTDLKNTNIKETPTWYMFRKPRYTKSTGEESFANTHKYILILLKQTSILTVYVIWEWMA